MRVAVVDSGGANIGSVCYALERLGAEAFLTGDADRIQAADRVILPGVGAAAAAMRTLRGNGLDRLIPTLDQPLLGICLGMQLLFESSDEGGVDCLGLLPGRITRLQPEPGVRVPHMGWNRLEPRADSPLLAGLPEAAYAYFVHSFAAPVNDHCVAAATHGRSFAAVVSRGRVHGAQFHPERSAATGARFLANFLALEDAA